MLHAAAKDAHRQLRQIEVRQQAPDHPILWGVPETTTWKFFPVPGDLTSPSAHCSHPPLRGRGNASQRIDYIWDSLWLSLEETGAE